MRALTPIMMLPGNITLAGFSDCDVTTLLVVQKVVGRYARAYANEPGFSRLRVVLTPRGREATMRATAIFGDQSYTAMTVNENLFVALGDSMEQLTTLVHQKRPVDPTTSVSPRQERS